MKKTILKLITAVISFLLLICIFSDHMQAVNAEETIAADAGTAYVIRTITDPDRNWGDLIFLRSEEDYPADRSWQTVTDIYGNEYEGIVFAKGDEIEGEHCDYPNGHAPWYNARFSTLKIYVAPNQKIKPKNMDSWFYTFMEVEEFDGTGFDTSECISVADLFYDCQKLERVNLKSFNTPRLRYVSGMFWRCKVLAEADLSSLNTDRCETFAEMFCYCYSLEKIDLSSINTAKMSGGMLNLFKDANKLKEVKLGPGFTVWTNNAYLPEGTWTNGTEVKTEKELYEEYPSHASDWAGTWTKMKDPVHVQSVSLNKTALILKEGESETLKASITPSDADNQNVSWRSSDSSIAEVDGNGKVSAVSPGNTVIFATSADGNHEASCDVTVTEAYHRFGTPEYTWSEDLHTVTAKVRCTLCNEEITETVNTVYEVIKEPALDERGAGRYTAVFTKEPFETQVKEVEIPSLSEQTLTLDTHKTSVIYGGTITLTASLNPADPDQKVVWSSSDDSVASVDQTGRIRGIKPGKAIITAKTDNGLSDTCEIRVLFTDVPSVRLYYYESVYWALDNEITVGAGGTGKFSPNAPCTREQIVTFLWRLKGEPEPESYQRFTDVKESDWFCKPISWAASKGITVGLNDGTGRFGVGQPCTREQCVTFLYRAADKPAVGIHQEFTDVTGDRYYYDAISWAASKGITVGLNDGTGRFGVGQNCTRAMIVTFLYRYDQVN